MGKKVGRPPNDFWSNVDKKGPNDCWNWILSGEIDKYGHVGNMSSHRYSYQLHNGSIPEGQCVRHTCDNKRCVNPAHLVLGTQKDNMRDMVERGRAIFQTNPNWQANIPPEVRTAWRKDEEKSERADQKTGAASANRWKDQSFVEKWVSSKGLSTKQISDRDVQEIRYLAKCGLGKRDIAPMYGISSSRCQYIMSRTTRLYRSIPDM